MLFNRLIGPRHTSVSRLSPNGVTLLTAQAKWSGMSRLAPTSESRQAILQTIHKVFAFSE